MDIQPIISNSRILNIGGNEISDSIDFSVNNIPPLNIKDDNDNDSIVAVKSPKAPFKSLNMIHVTEIQNQSAFVIVGPSSSLMSITGAEEYKKANPLKTLKHSNQIGAFSGSSFNSLALDTFDDSNTRTPLPQLPKITPETNTKKGSTFSRNSISGSALPSYKLEQPRPEIQTFLKKKPLLKRHSFLGSFVNSVQGEFFS